MVKKHIARFVTYSVLVVILFVIICVVIKAQVLIPLLIAFGIFLVMVGIIVLYEWALNNAD